MLRAVPPRLGLLAATSVLSTAVRAAVVPAAVVPVPRAALPLRAAHQALALLVRVAFRAVARQ